MTTFYPRLMELAAKSNCLDRKVACILLDAQNKEIASGYNYSLCHEVCQRTLGRECCSFHAARQALNMWYDQNEKKPITAITNWFPDDISYQLLIDAGIQEVQVWANDNPDFNNRALKVATLRPSQTINPSTTNPNHRGPYLMEWWSLWAAIATKIDDTTPIETTLLRIHEKVTGLSSHKGLAHTTLKEVAQIIILLQRVLVSNGFNWSDVNLTLQQLIKHKDNTHGN